MVGSFVILAGLASLNTVCEAALVNADTHKSQSTFWKSLDNILKDEEKVKKVDPVDKKSKLPDTVAVPSAKKRQNEFFRQDDFADEGLRLTAGM